MCQLNTNLELYHGLITYNATRSINEDIELNNMIDRARNK